MIGSNVGKYRVLDRIGRGGMGTVYHAVDETLYREVAIKVINADLDDPEVAKRFRTEAITVARLSHPGIATIYELFQHEGQWLMVMEFVRGETLERMAENMGGLSPQRAAEFCIQALTALAHAHSMGVVHRDLKPANLMITETGAIKIMDFGIARVAGAEHLTNVGFTMGTPAYMAPEQVMGTEVDARADLYAMGVVFYRLTAGKLPFKGETPFAMAQSHVHDPPTPVGQFRTDLPPWVESIISKALAKSPEDRFQSAAEFQDAFARALAGLPMRSGNATTRTDAFTTLDAGAPALALRPPAGSVQESLHRSGTQASDPTTRMSEAVGAIGAGMLDGSADTKLAPITSQPPAAVATPGRRNAILLSVAVVLIVGGAAVGGVLWHRGRNAAAQVVETPSPSEAPSSSPGPGPPTSPAATPPNVPIPSATTSTIPAPRSGRADGTAAGRSSDVTAQVAAATNPGSVPVAAIPEPPVNDVHQAFADVKMINVSGTKATDQDVVLSFVAGQISVLGKNSGAVLTTMPYKQVVRATYVRARDPKWDKSLPGPPPGLDVGSFMRTAKPWLVLQTNEAYVILRLDDRNVTNVLEKLEASIHTTIDRPKSADK